MNLPFLSEFSIGLIFLYFYQLYFLPLTMIGARVWQGHDRLMAHLLPTTLAHVIETIIVHLKLSLAFGDLGHQCFIFVGYKVGVVAPSLEVETRYGNMFFLLGS